VLTQGEFGLLAASNVIGNVVLTILALVLMALQPTIGPLWAIVVSRSEKDCENGEFLLFFLTLSRQFMAICLP
jgi:hypothetical protein